MATLISVHNSDGCVGRCDAKCYDAITAACECDCICGGRNHGAGRKTAENNTREMCDEWIERYIKEKQVVNGRGEVNGDIFQLKLF